MHVLLFLIYPYFYYRNKVWASTYKTNPRGIFILQKRIIRITNKSHFQAHTDPIFQELGILKFNDIHLLQLGQFMYPCKMQKFIVTSMVRMSPWMGCQSIAAYLPPSSMLLVPIYTPGPSHWKVNQRSPGIKF